MKTLVKAVTVVFVSQSLSGCFVGTTAAVMQKISARNAETRPPEYIDIEQEGRIITASFEVSGYKIGHSQAAQMRGFNKWANAAVVREASKRGCVNVINAFSAGGGMSASATNASTNLGSRLQFKCLEKENIMSEQDLLEDKKVIYSEQIEYIDTNPQMIRYK